MAKIKYNEDGTREDGQVSLLKANQFARRADEGKKAQMNELATVAHKAVDAAFRSPLSRREVKPQR